MRIAVEISLYPLDADYIPPIKDFIERVRADTELTVVTNAMSTQIVGEHKRVFEALSRETEKTFAEGGRRVFVMKVLGGEPSAQEIAAKP
jgi:uncharacterized protein YqgV (UPF0045/DUF77 family)